jgi:hypothetical protein
MIVPAHHHCLQTGTAQFIANALRRIERQVLFPQKNRRPSSADAAAILSTVTRIDDDGRKMAGPSRHTRRLRASADEKDDRNNHREGPEIETNRAESNHEMRPNSIDSAAAASESGLKEPVES